MDLIPDNGDPWIPQEIVSGMPHGSTDRADFKRRLGGGGNLGRMRNVHIHCSFIISNFPRYAIRRCLRFKKSGCKSVSPPFPLAKGRFISRKVRAKSVLIFGPVSEIWPDSLVPMKIDGVLKVRSPALQRDRRMLGVPHVRLRLVDATTPCISNFCT
jgi:hypothetical protein